jgi:predicted nucleotidyltransferase
MRIKGFLSQVKAWTEQQADIKGVLLVGSYARGVARADSDVDLVILTTKPERYLDSVSFAENFGSVSKWEKEDWGRVTSVRVWYQDGLEVEYGITLPDWVAQPLDSGTLRVVSDGMQIVFDRDGSLSWLSELQATSGSGLAEEGSETSA